MTACGARRASSRICSRVAMVPEGLLGLAMAMILVRGVMDAASCVERKLKVVAGQNRDDARIGCGGVDLVHGVGGNGQKQFVAFVEKGFEEDVNGFVDAVGEGHLRGCEAEMRGDDGLDGFALGIARECAGGDAAEDFAHRGRTGERVLVEVEAQAVAAPREAGDTPSWRGRARAARVESRACGFSRIRAGPPVQVGCEWLRRGR